MAHSPSVPIPAYVSSRSANALISELRPTTLTADALLHLNLVLDELLAALVAAAQSIAPEDIKTKGINKVFANVTLAAPGTPERSSPVQPAKPRTRTTSSSGKARTHFRSVSTSLQVTKDAASLALGREAVNEAELELKAWRDTRASPDAVDGYARDPRGLTQGQVGSGFPVAQAVDLLRCRIMAYSTLGNDKPDADTLRWLTDMWIQAGGSAADDVIAPAALYMTAIIEHVSERILAGIGRLIARSTSSTTAGLYDLYSALCEDEATWGFFKRMSVKSAIEGQLQITPSSIAYNLGRTVTRDSFSSSIHGGGIDQDGSLGIRGPSLDMSTPSHARKSVSLSRRTPSFDSPRPSLSGIVHKRSSLGLQRTVSAIAGGGTRRVSMDEDKRVVPEDEFDALVASGKTLKVTLTPSRLKSFDTARHHGATPTRALNDTDPFVNHRSLSPIPPTVLGRSNPSLLSRHTSVSSTSSAAASVPSKLKLAPRDESNLGRGSPAAETHEDDIGPVSRDQGKGQTLKDVLQSEPPWGAQASAQNLQRNDALAVPRIVSPTGIPVLGMPIGSPVNSERSTRGLSPRIETGSPKAIRSETADLADFLKNTPPPPHSNGLRRESLNEFGHAESPSRLKSLVNRVTGGKQADRASYGQNQDPHLGPLGRRVSASSPNKLQRTSLAKSTAFEKAGRAPTQGLFSSRDRHIEDECIGPSTLNPPGRRGQQERMMRPMVEVGSVVSEDASLRAMNLSSPGSVDPGFYSPGPAASQESSRGDSVPAGGQTQETREMKPVSDGNERVPAVAIPIEDILQLRQDMKQAHEVSECWVMLEELLRRYGVSQST